MPILLLFLFLLFLQPSSAQSTYNIQFPQQNRDQICQRCTQAFARKPNEVKFSIQVDDNNTIYFEVTDKNWFNEVFKNSGDGLALDLVSKERYGCLEILLDVGQIRGELLPPVYAQELRKTLRPYGKDRFRARLGKVPAAYQGKQIEFNMLFLKDKNLCRYQTIYNLAAYRWDLLDMGMYLDSVTYLPKTIARADEEAYTMRYKTLTFTIPFEKNKSTYSPEDIKPMYDSLRLTDFNITRINIRGYSSVEGNLERNLELQQGRAKSIVDALQSFQQPAIVTEVSSAENWVEFLTDIEGGSFEYLKDLSKNAVKGKLTGETAAELEPLLSRHRKAVVKLDLERKDPYKDQSVEDLVGMFNNALNENSLSEAERLQQSIFEKLKNKEADPSTLNQMRIPQQVEYLAFLNRRSGMRYLLDERYLLIAFNELEALEKLAPDDKRVKYNLAALRLKLWRYSVQPVDESKLRSDIAQLNNFGIDPGLVERMLVNFNIVKSEFLMRKRDYQGKDKAVDYIYSHYQKVPLTDVEYLSLSQYLAYYANTDKAVQVIQDRVKRIDVDEDLLFYYLNLTLVDKELTGEDSYRTIMLNAINLNKERYCELFNAPADGGVTFQLLENDYLRDTYCENCVSE
ncbi:hypothetical protein [Muriicola marianensis]|uniref:OmpA family protein n=1 Tax=Muriicola marianensis TaxID=1324801 RepID=A0ABQ1QQ80_9FLAO|nr:hypothetical protein [Muriicola marianensis]GGD37215.1 hypothetical protein GCM10011361_00340 [Muriicola marianensis]